MYRECYSKNFAGIIQAISFLLSAAFVEVSSESTNGLANILYLMPTYVLFQALKVRILLHGELGTGLTGNGV